MSLLVRCGVGVPPWLFDQARTRRGTGPSSLALSGSIAAAGVRQKGTSSFVGAVGGCRDRGPRQTLVVKRASRASGAVDCVLGFPSDCAGSSQALSRASLLRATTPRPAATAAPAVL